MSIALLALLAVLLAWSAFFSSSETALFSLDRLALGQLERGSDRSSRRVLRLLAQPARLLSTILLGNTLVNVAGSAVAATLFVSLYADVGVWLALLIETSLILLFGEIVPKCVALNFSLPLSRRSVAPLAAFYRLGAPLVLAATWIADLVVRPPAGERGRELPAREISGAELRDLVADVGERGILSPEELKLSQRILQFASTTVEEVMTPWIDVAKISRHASREEAEEELRRSMHSRVPVYRRDADDVVGYLTAKTYLANPASDMGSHLRAVMVVPENLRARDVLREMRRRHRHLVVAVNEFGRPVGIVTAEDLLEEIVGEIYDEFEIAEELVVPLGAGRYRVSGQAGLDEVGEELDLRLSPSEEGIVTLSGYLCHLAGEIPEEKVRIHENGITFKVLEVDRHRITWVEVIGKGKGTSDG